MTKQDALNAIETLVKQKEIYKNSQAYATIIHAINNPDTPVPCGKNTGSGRFSSSTSWRNQVTEILSRAGIAYSTGNSAPKGGAAGDNVVVHLDK